MRQQTRAATLHKGELQRLIKITRATSKLPEREVLVLMLSHKAGLRIIEISRITVADVMFPSGKLREEFSLRAAVTKGCRRRKKLRARSQVHAQVAVHGTEGLGKLGAGFRVVTTDPQTLFN